MITTSLEQLGPDNSSRTIIVGGGTVGIYLGVLLARAGKEVVIIEAGNESLGNFDADTYENAGFPHQGISIGRSKSLGGTSNLWGGQLVEFQRVDFAGRDWIPDSKWPVSYEEISSYYRPTYRNLGLDEATLDDQEVFRRVKTPVPSFPEGVELFLTRWLKIPSMAGAFRDELLESSRVKTLLNHVVTGFESKEGRINSVSLADLNGNAHRLSGDNVILAAGTIETARLLLHAASSDETCPWRDNQNVGRYFQDHIGGRVAAVHPIDKERFFDLFSSIVLGGSKFQPKLRLKNETLEQDRVMNMHAMLQFESSVSENLVFLKQFLKAAVFSRKVSNFGQLIPNLIACGTHLPPLMWRYIVQNRVFVPSGSKISFILQSEQTPLADSRITLDRSHRDRFGLPKVILDWRLGSDELPSMWEFTDRCSRALRESGLADLRLLEGMAKRDPAFINTLRDNYHHVGGARMGTSASDGVVDSQLRVFGTDNLYVLGASTFRTASNANTTFVAMSFATRLAEHLGKTGAVLS